MNRPTISHWFTDIIARLLIRFKRIKQVSYSAEELNELIVDALPYKDSFPVPAGIAELTVLTAEVDIGDSNQQGLDIKLLCSLDIRCLEQQLYRAHLDIVLNALPFFAKDERAIRVNHSRIKHLSLVQDEYLLIKSSTSLIRALTPNLLKGIVDVTLGSAFTALSIVDGAVKGVKVPVVKDYLLLFTDNNKQKVIDYHRPQVEQHINQLFNSGELQYQLEDSDYEEKLFADLGTLVEVNHGELVFRFD